MKIYLKFVICICVLTSVLIACRQKNGNAVGAQNTVVMKGLYSFGPEMKSFTDCEEGREFWVADSAKTLELEYNKLGFEKPYTPVYIEVECKLIRSDTTVVTADYDSTMIVTKLRKISREIPEGPCSQ